MLPSGYAPGLAASSLGLMSLLVSAISTLREAGPGPTGCPVIGAWLTAG